MEATNVRQALPVGVYGLRLVGVEPLRPFLVSAPSNWPTVEVVQTRGQGMPGRFLLDDERAELTVATGGQIVVERRSGRAVLAMPDPLSEEELLHPYLGYIAALVARLSGRLSFHAGAVVAGGGAWALVGEREAGKSSTLAWLALEGLDVLCDDVLVLDGTTAFAGPRLVDLRWETAQQLAAGTPLTDAGARERWRVSLDEVEAEQPLLGFVFLTWGERLETVPLSASERLLRLTRELSVRRAPQEPGALLALAALPGWELRRPRQIDSLSAAGCRLLETISA